MKKTIALTCLLTASVSAYAGEKGDWGYSGEHGPEHWASLTADNFACSGKNQSPVNLSGFIKSQLDPIDFDYKNKGTEILNNGHTVQINFKAGNTIHIDGIDYTLLQSHFHAPSENHINGQSYPLEAHLVHSDKQGNLAVIGVMFDVGAPNKGLESAWAMMPHKKGDQHTLKTGVSATDMLPESREYYRFSGSLTTPPCSEGVRWFVMKEALTASTEQIHTFQTALNEPNNRPLQPLNARTILQ